MPQVERAALVGFSASQMYALVNDVERYPQFLPGCGGARLLSASDTELMPPSISPRRGCERPSPPATVWCQIVRLS